MGRRKTFHPGQSIEVQRDVDTPWETASYRNQVIDMPGYHWVDLDSESAPRRSCLIPSRRIRAEKGK